ncbi:MAG: hypothetical protein RJA22_877 [Verrucomicrobiota bacterium]
MSLLPASLFFLSGAAALGLQITWTRLFSTGLGHEVPALLGLITAFLGGMALGGWLLDRPIAASARPARWYAALQFATGAWAALATLLLPALHHAALALTGPAPGPGRHAVIALLLPLLALLPATAAMGATLPAMDRWLAALTPGQRCVGRVYALNTAGAVLGTLATPFLLQPTLGLRTTALLLAGLHLAAGAAAWTAALPPASTPPSTDPPRDPSLGALAFLTGLLGIGLEIVGVRLLSQALENTVYTFAAVLAVYLLGTSLGAAAGQRWGRHRPFRPLLAALLALLATLVFLAASVAARLLPLHDALRAQRGDNPGGALLAELALAALFFGPPTLVMGATFSHLVQQARGAHGGVGRAAALNTLGGALAGLVFGLLLLPALGAKWTLLCIGLAYLALSQVPAGPPPAPARRIALPLLLLPLLPFGLALALPHDLRLVRVPPGAVVREHREGAMATVAVLQTPDGHRSLRVNNRFQMGGTAAAVAQRRQAHLPLLLHPEPRRALFLGPGTGITLGAARDYPGLAAEGVELLPEIVALMPRFEPENRGPFRRDGDAAPGAPLVHAADARRFVRAAPGRYDVIVADLFHPAQDGAAFLYTREQFAAVRDRLAPGGLFCQWLPLHQLDEPTLRVIVRTFLDVFPDSRAFLLHFNVDIPVLGLVGAREGPFQPGPDAVERRAGAPGLLPALKAAGLDRTLNLLGCAAAGPAGLTAFAAGAEANTDDHPRVLFRAPRTRTGAAGAPGALLPTLLERWAPDPLRGLDPARAPAGLADFVAARDQYLHALHREAAGQVPEAIEGYLESTRRSLYFTPAYARLVTIIQVLAATDRPAARRLWERLETAQPAQPLGRRLLTPLLEEPRQ